MAGIGGAGGRSRNGFGGVVLDGFRSDGGGKGGSRERFHGTEAVVGGEGVEF